MKHSMPRLEYEQEVLAKFLSAGSAVFHIDERAIQKATVGHNGLIEGVPPKGFVVLGVDLARSNDYTVLYGARMRDRRNCYFERMQAVTWPEQKRRIRRAVKTLERAGAENVMLVMDSTGVGDPIVEDLEIEGYDVVPINFTTYKANMVRLLAKDLEEAQAFVLEDYMDEFRAYTMSITPGGRLTYSAPEGEHDDIVSAKMLCHWGVVNEGFGEVSLDLLPKADAPSDDTSVSANDEDDFSDLVYDDISAYAEADRRPSPEELIANPDVWF
jgi:hypothetical protein